MTMKILIARVSLATILVLAATLLAAAESGNMPGTKEGTMMKDAAFLTAGIPPIDASAPPKTETATFALG
jgi:hypothetical protein